jgi:hypothetical protein
MEVSEAHDSDFKDLFLGGAIFLSENIEHTYTWNTYSTCR